MIAVTCPQPVRNAVTETWSNGQNEGIDQSTKDSSSEPTVESFRAVDVAHVASRATE